MTIPCIDGDRLNDLRAFTRDVMKQMEEDLGTRLVDDKIIRIHGSKASLEQAVIAGEQIGKGVRSFIRKWRAHQNKNANTYVIEVAL